MKKSILKEIAVLPLAAVMVSCGRAAINHNDYLEVKYDGLDTAARASFTVDYEQMVKDNLKAFGIKDEDDDHDIERAVTKLKKYLGGELDKTSQLSNGDTITFEWDDDKVEKLEKKYKIKLKVEDKEIKVTDLEEAKEFDPFDYITLEYTGVGPDAYAKVKVDSSFPVSYNYFRISPSSGLSNGDKVTVTFGSSGDSDYIKEECFDEGYLPTSFEKEFKVEGVQSYVTKIDEVEKASYDKMDKYARAEFDKLVDTWEKKELKDIELVGVNLYTPKDKNAYWGKNALCYVYKVTTNKPEGFKDDKEEEKTTEAPTEAATEAKTEAETTTAKAEEATKAEDDKTTTTTAKDDKKSETTTTTAKADDKKDDKKTDDKKNSKDTYEYYYFTSFVNVLTPDNSKDKEYPASYVQKPEYFNFFGVSGDAFVKGNVLFEGFETLDDLNKAMEDKYPSSKCETNIKKK